MVDTCSFNLACSVIGQPHISLDLVQPHYNITVSFQLATLGFYVALDDVRTIDRVTQSTIPTIVSNA